MLYIHYAVTVVKYAAAARGLLGCIFFPIHQAIDGYCQRNLGREQYSQIHMGGSPAWKKLDMWINFLLSIKPSVVICAIQTAGHNPPGTVSVPEVKETH
jgi:hypothetical protein